MHIRAHLTVTLKMRKVVLILAYIESSWHLESVIHSGSVIVGRSKRSFVRTQDLLLVVYEEDTVLYPEKRNRLGFYISEDAGTQLSIAFEPLCSSC